MAPPPTPKSTPSANLAFPRRDSADEAVQVDLREETRSALRDLIAQVSLVAVTVGSLVTLIAALRILSHGWHPNALADLVIFGAIILIVLLRRHLPTRLVLGCLIGIVCLSTVVNVLTLGLASISFAMLAVAAALTAIAFGIQAGVILVFGAIVTVTGLGALLGWQPWSRDLTPEGYLYRPTVWATQISGFAVYTLAMLVAIGSIQTRLVAKMREANRSARDLVEREQRYRLLAESMRDVLVVQDMHLDIVYVSPSVERVFGHTVEAVMALRMADLMTPASLATAMADFGGYAARARQGPVDVPLLEYEYVRRDGSTFWGEIQPAFLYDAGGRLIGTQVLLRDIDERKRAEALQQDLEERLRQSVKLQAIGELAGGIAHDFNNQLAGIIGQGENMKLTHAADPAVVAAVERMLVPAERAVDLTAKLLAFARKGQYRPEPIEVHALIDEVVAILSRSIDRNIVIACDLGADRAVVRGDATQLQSALLNLALNARDAMPTGGTLTFATVRSANRLHLEVIDTGVGMDPTVLDHIFEPFFTTKAVGQGTGMGLAAVYGTVKSMGGEISVTSIPHQGSRFLIDWPICDDDPTTAEGSEAVATIGTRDAHILLIDDEATVRDATGHGLRNLGYRVTACADGATGLEIFREDPAGVDLVLLDLVLPGLAGGEVFNRMRQIDPAIRVLIISGYGADETVQALLDAGALGFLKKPVRIRALGEAVAAALGAKV